MKEINAIHSEESKKRDLLFEELYQRLQTMTQLLETARCLLSAGEGVPRIQRTFFHSNIASTFSKLSEQLF